ncbi:MAG: CotH kinase family protein, partial [Clostridiales bacterium]|nr:CotH kinase family protein [Clostridiales bacterium]
MNKKWKYKALLTTLALLFLFASTVSAEEISPPFFSHSGGFYSDNFDLRISAAVGMTIRYTTDGSEPTNRSAVYSAPIYIHSPEANAANSPMTMSIRNVPHDTNDGESGGPNFMPEPYYNGMVVRARAFNANGEGSATVTHSYFVERDGRGVFNTPVLSVSIEPEHFIDPVIGIYTNWDDRTWYSATEFDPADGPRHIVFVEAFGANGELLFAQRANAWVAGDWSRQHPRKSLRFNFNQGDGDLTNMYEFIPDTRANWNEPLTHIGTFRHVTARTSDLFESGIRDIVSALVAEPLRADIQNGVFGAIFINGEFWGMYDLREHRHEAYIAAHYPGIRRGSIEINTNYGVGDLYFQEIRPLGDLSEQARYERLKAIVDMDNFIDAFIAGFHLQNWDWLNNNFDYWRTTTVDPDIYGHDGRWRFIIQDFDGALQGEFSWIGQSWDMLNYLSDIELEILPEWVDAWLPEFVINLFSNEEFRNTFAARYSTYAGTIFHPSRTDAVVDDLLHARRDTIQGDLTRWTWRRGDIGSWKRQTEHVRTILNSR